MRGVLKDLILFLINIPMLKMYYAIVVYNNSYVILRTTGAKDE